MQGNTHRNKFVAIMRKWQSNIKIGSKRQKRTKEKVI
jgi:hypothetical protein